MRDIDQSRYFAITSLSFDYHFFFFFSYLKRSLTAHRSDLPCVVSITHEQNIICNKTHFDSTTHEQTIICRQLFAGHVVGSRSMKRKGKMNRMIKPTDCFEPMVSTERHLLSRTWSLGLIGQY